MRINTDQTYTSSPIEPDKRLVRNDLHRGPNVPYEYHYGVITPKLNKRQGTTLRDIRVIRHPHTNRALQIDVRQHWSRELERETGVEKPEWRTLRIENGYKLLDHGYEGRWEKQMPRITPYTDGFDPDAHMVPLRTRGSLFVGDDDWDSRIPHIEEHVFNGVVVRVDGMPARNFHQVVIRHSAQDDVIHSIMTVRTRNAQPKQRPLDSAWQHWARKLLAADATPPPNIEENPTMKAELANTILALQSEQGIVKTVRVIFDDDLTNHIASGKPLSDYAFDGMQEYTYKTHMMDLEVGEIVVVEARNGYNVCPVVGVDDEVDLTSGKQLKWVVQRMGDSLSQLTETKKNEAAAANKLAKTQALKKALEAAEMAGVDLASLKTLLIGHEAKEQAEELSK